ncbi:MAG TPA: uracil-DNA glycosylase [Candidatus Saccharimonadales bacterium]|nr:uracil-DNA glycosylase [Candidatus Saccharimonadales bacterium]
MSLAESIPRDWAAVLGEAMAAPSFAELETFVARERARGEVYPPADKVFASLRLTPFAKVRAVILGQDPYHGPCEAQGLAFSVAEGRPRPPSLHNILAEWARDLERPMPSGGSLEAWARHGVLLLNAVLTVRRDKAWSHAHPGWNHFNAAILSAVNAKREPVAFLLWGRRAQDAGTELDAARHIIIRSSHPSGRSARRSCGDSPAFVGSAPFSRANAELARRHRPPVNWDL